MLLYIEKSTLCDKAGNMSDTVDGVVSYLPSIASEFLAYVRKAFSIPPALSSAAMSCPLLFVLLSAAIA